MKAIGRAASYLSGAGEVCCKAGRDRSRVKGRHARDLPEVLGWIREGAPLPTTVRDSNFNPHRLLTLRTRNSAAYKGIYALLDKVAVDRVRNQEYVVPGDGSEDDRCGGQDAVYDE